MKLADLQTSPRHDLCARDRSMSQGFLQLGASPAPASNFEIDTRGVRFVLISVDSKLLLYTSASGVPRVVSCEPHLHAKMKAMRGRHALCA